MHAKPIFTTVGKHPRRKPHVFGDRIYVYGSHDTAYSDSFCDIRLKAWSAPVTDLSHWICHGDIFHAQADEYHAADVTWYKNGRLYAPDVIAKDGKYYLFAYVFYGKGCVAVSNTPHGPFKLLSTYRYGKTDDFTKDFCKVFLWIPAHWLTTTVRFMYTVGMKILM